MPLPARAFALLACCIALGACDGGHHGATVSRTRPSAGGPPPTTTTTPPPAAPARLPTCAPAQLKLRVVSTQGAAGHLEATFAVRNSSPSRCRLFGFPGAIAHGMWTKARCLASFEGRTPDAFTVDAAFKSPLRIPARATLLSGRRDGGWAFRLESPDGERTHLIGSLRG